MIVQKEQILEVVVEVVHSHVALALEEIAIVHVLKQDQEQIIIGALQQKQQ